MEHSVDPDTRSGGDRKKALGPTTTITITSIAIDGVFTFIFRVREYGYMSLPYIGKN